MDPHRRAAPPRQQLLLLEGAEPPDGARPLQAPLAPEDLAAARARCAASLDELSVDARLLTPGPAAWTAELAEEAS